MDVAHQHMLSARAHGGDQMDWTALVGGERISAGLKPFGSRVCVSSLLSLPLPSFLPPHSNSLDFVFAPNPLVPSRPSLLGPRFFRPPLGV